MRVRTWGEGNWAWNWLVTRNLEKLLFLSERIVWWEKRTSSRHFAMFVLVSLSTVRIKATNLPSTHGRRLVTQSMTWSLLTNLTVSTNEPASLLISSTSFPTGKRRLNPTCPSFARTLQKPGNWNYLIF